MGHDASELGNELIIDESVTIRPSSADGGVENVSPSSSSSNAESGQLQRILASMGQNTQRANNVQDEERMQIEIMPETQAPQSKRPKTRRSNAGSGN